MSKIIDSVTLFCTNKKTYNLEPVNPIILDIKESFTDVGNYSSEYLLSATWGYRFWLKDNDKKNYLPELQHRMLRDIAEYIFSEFRPKLNNLFKIAYKNGDQETIDLLHDLEEQMFKINFKG